MVWEHTTSLWLSSLVEFEAKYQHHTWSLEKVARRQCQPDSLQCYGCQRPSPGQKITLEPSCFDDI